MLTAYGLLLFNKLSAVYPNIDKSMVNRARTWLLSRKDGRGRFDQRPGKYSFSNPDRNVSQGKPFPRLGLTDSAYILWALTTENPTEDLELELNTAFNTASTSEDSYLVSLTALALLNVRCS